jgi:hypothetical protein
LLLPVVGDVLGVRYQCARRYRSRLSEPDARAD